MPLLGLGTKLQWKPSVVLLLSMLEWPEPTMPMVTDFLRTAHTKNQAQRAALFGDTLVPNLPGAAGPILGGQPQRRTVDETMRLDSY